MSKGDEATLTAGETAWAELEEEQKKLEALGYIPSISGGMIYCPAWQQQRNTIAELEHENVGLKQQIAESRVERDKWHRDVYYPLWVSASQARAVLEDKTQRPRERVRAALRALENVSHTP